MKVSAAVKLKFHVF